MPQRGDEVVHQPELGRLPVDVGRDEEEARLGAQHRVGRQQVLACAALWTQHGGDTGGEEQQDEDGADQRRDGVHGCSPAARQKNQAEVEMGDFFRRGSAADLNASYTSVASHDGQKLQPFGLFHYFKQHISSPSFAETQQCKKNGKARSRYLLEKALIAACLQSLLIHT